LVGQAGGTGRFGVSHSSKLSGACDDGWPANLLSVGPFEHVFARVHKT
jgi:hypothetical protein